MPVVVALVVETVSVEDAELAEANVTAVGFKVHDSPAGVTLPTRLTVPLKLLRLIRVIVDVPEAPCWRAIFDGLEDIVKSGELVTLTVTLVEWDIEPLVPVTLTV